MSYQHDFEGLGKRVLISGGTGFIGSGVARQLNQVHAHVGVITRSRPVEQVEWIEIAAPNHFPADAVGEFNPDVVIHLATQFLASHRREDISSLVRSNIEFGTELLESASQTGATFVNVSSAWQHFEGNDYSPVSLYAATKQAFLDIAKYYVETGLDFRNLTIYDTYGPRDTRNKIVNQLLEAAASDQQIAMSSGDQLINLLEIDDVVAAILKIASLPTSKESPSLDFVARAQESISIRQLVGIVEMVTGKKINVIWGAREPRPREMTTDWVFGVALPDWTPSVTLVDGLNACWQEITRAT